MARAAVPRAGLAPPRHAGVDQCGVELLGIPWTNTKFLGHPRAEALDEYIGVSQQVMDPSAVFGVGEVGGDDGAIAQGEVTARVIAERVESGTRTLDAHHVGA